MLGYSQTQTWDVSGCCFVLLAMVGCSAAEGTVSPSGTGGETSENGAAGASATSTSAGGSSDLGGTLGASDAGAYREACDVSESTRSCCDGLGTQTCGRGELPTWGPCVDDYGTVITCNFVPSPPEMIPEPPPAEPPPDEPPPEPPPPEPPPQEPPPVCSTGMACKPGAIRYCDVVGFEFTMATCDATGQWGPCNPTVAPPGWCDPTGFSPELCCPPLGLCCQNDPGGPFEDWGSGACGEIACP